jgi:hypothetical protein
MSMKVKVFLLVLGFLVGLAAAVLAPGLRERLMPEGWRGAPTEGVVEEKRSEEGRLLLTLVTADGAVLATFTQRVAEIDLLVAPGDTVSLSLDGYRPFVEDPEIARVIKAPAAAFEVDPGPAIVPAIDRPPEEVLPEKDLPDEELPDEDLPEEDLPEEDLPEDRQPSDG